MASYRCVSRRPGMSIPLPATPPRRGTGNDGPVSTATASSFLRPWPGPRKCTGSRWRRWRRLRGCVLEISSSLTSMPPSTSTAGYPPVYLLNEGMLDDLRSDSLPLLSDASAAEGLLDLVHDELVGYGTSGDNELDDKQIALAI